jgi:hypothetical protein
MPVSTVGELSTKYPKWNISMMSSLGNDSIALAFANSEDSYVCKAVNNPNSQTVYTTTPFQTPLEAANAMDAILSNLNANTKFASVMAMIRVTATSRVFGKDLLNPEVEPGP